MKRLRIELKRRLKVHVGVRYLIVLVPRAQPGTRPVPIHHKITGFYGSVQGFTDGLRVRDWLNGQSFEFQKKFGLDILKMFGAR